MNRFDSSFNGIDSITSRPFSGGYPDGLWMVAIYYGLYLVAAVVLLLVVIITLILGGGFNFMPIIPAIALTAIFSPPIMFLFNRSKVALYYSYGLLVMAFLIAIGTYIFKAEMLAMVLIPFVIQIYICYYLNKLQSENLIGQLS